ncbi:hypothetical protein IAT38_006649 [Cryptococcus sp. DSM 104549]
MSLNHHLPKKISLAPKKHHGFQFVLFLLGLVLPPFAVALRFGIGSDFALNVFLCICGYIPCHFHNFYIQNIRNNQNRARTPKWAVKYGLVDNSERERRLRKNQWAKRFDERNAHSTLQAQELEEGEEGPNYDPTTETPEEIERRRNEGLWSAEDEEYYNADANRAPNQRNWHYPANFEGTVGDGRSYKRKANKSSSSDGGDRWQRAAGRRSSTASSTNNTYPPHASTDDDVPEWGKDYGSKRRSSKSKGSNNSSSANNNTGGGSRLSKKQDHTHDWARNPEYDYGSGGGDAGWGNGSASGGRTGGSNGNGNAAAKPSGNGDPNWDHQF